MSAPSGQQIHLDHAGQQLTVVEVGGGIRTYAVGGRAVIDGYDETEMCPGGRGQLLAPWPNRLADGRFEWHGQTYRTPLSEPENHNAIHGLVRWSAWTVTLIDEGQVQLYFRLHPQPGWPWPLDLSVAYHLQSEGLEVVTTVTNAGDRRQGACPVGVGWHPYLAAFGGLVDDVFLTVPAEQVYLSDDRGLPTGRHSVEGTPADFRSGRQVGDAVLDVAFTSLSRQANGRAEVSMTPAAGAAGAPSARDGIRLWVDSAYSHLMIFSGDTLDDVGRRRRGLAVEPMTCAPDMLRNGDGRRVLEPGESFGAAWGVQTFSFS
jgi:aldose 1-epimerase